MGVDDVDGGIRSAMLALSAFVTSRVTIIMMTITIVTTVMTIVAAIVIIVTSIFMMGGMGSLFGFFGIGISVRHLYQLADGGGPLAV